MPSPKRTYHVPALGPVAATSVDDAANQAAKRLTGHAGAYARRIDDKHDADWGRFRAYRPVTEDRADEADEFSVI
jgi:hypothetical protein